MEIEKEIKSPQNDIASEQKTTKNNNIYSNLSTTEEIIISFGTSKQEKNVMICPEFYVSKDIFRRTNESW